jgi:predicted alpha/beta-fold hydrolase
LIRGVCGVSAAIDLAACAHRIHERDNYFYELRFVAAMRARLRATGKYSERELAGVRSVLEIDDRFTAPAFGLVDAANYYRTQSAVVYLPAIRVPTLLIQAQDDTFVPFAAFESDAVRSNPSIQLLATRYGGHVAFLARRPPRLWLDQTVIKWILKVEGL